MSVKNSRTFLETILGFLNLKTIKSDTDNIAGEVTANAGTNLNTSLLALESGGNLSGLKTKVDSALIKCNTDSIAGTVTANAGTNLNTSALALESGGNLSSVKTKLDGALTKCDTDDIKGVVTANAGTNLNTSLLALEAGNLADIKGSVVSAFSGDYLTAPITVSSSSSNVSLISAPGANKQIWVYSISFIASENEGTVEFKGDTSLNGVMVFKDGSGMVVSPSGNFLMPLWKLGTNKALTVTTSDCAINGSIGYSVVDV